VFALATGFLAIESGLIPTACAQEEETSEPTDDGESEAPADESKEEDNEADKSNDTDQDPPAEVAEDKPSSDTPASEEKSDKPADDKKADEKKEQEAAEDASGDEVSEAEKAADEEEEAKAAAEEAAGADVETDESEGEEEEPEDSKQSPNRPAINGDKPVKETPSSEKRVIGATATIMEKQSELLFRARVDSGAKSCSLHIEDYKIENESDTMAENIGKVVRFNIKNGDGESHWLEAKIAGYVIVKNAAHRERRYKVPLTFRYKDFEKTVLVTLNNREKMEFPLLLGRNFLMGDFVIDVEVDNTELHTR
jgi:hypothetical protein